jgi:hypothetical protein
MDGEDESNACVQEQQVFPDQADGNPCWKVGDGNADMPRPVMIERSEMHSNFGEEISNTIFVRIREDPLPSYVLSKAEPVRSPPNLEFGTKFR